MQYDDTLSLSNTLRYLTHDVRSGGPGATANLYDKRHSKALSFLMYNQLTLGLAHVYSSSYRGAARGQGLLSFTIRLEDTANNYTGCKPGKVNPNDSSQPYTQLRACTAFPAAPFSRLSRAAMITTRLPSSLEVSPRRFPPSAPTLC